MPPPSLDFPAGHVQPADVGTPQVVNLVWPPYQSGILSDMVAAGRAKSAVNSEQVPETREGSEAPLEGWSRGCRRAHVSFWFWQWFRPWLPVPRKKSRLKRLKSPSSRPTPASTSNLPARACQLRQSRPAPNLGLLRYSAVDRQKYPEESNTLPWQLWAVVQFLHVGSADCHDRSMDRC
jgi:hypothetical protein